MNHSVYSKYKPSGVDWLGDVPKHWEIKKLKWAYRSIGSGDGISPNDIEPIGEYPVYGGNGIMGYTENFNAEGDDIIIGRVGAKCGNVYLISGKKWISDNALRLDIDKCDKRYLFQFLMARNLNQLANQNAQPLITGSMVGNQFIPFPPHPEQRVIADFLDRRTGEIDDLIAKKERVIELLREKRAAIISHAVTKGLNPDAKMKDSGIDWLGDVPEHWEVMPLKRWVKIKITDGPHETPNLIDDGIPFVSAEAVRDGKINFDAIRGYISHDLHKQYIKKCYPRKNDIFMIKSGATTGNLALVDTDCEFSIWSPLALIRANEKKILPKYLFLSLHADYVQNQVQTLWSFGTQQNIGMGIIERLYVIAPSVKEQYIIVGHLDRETSKIDELIAKVTEAIERLKEYRTALISAAVVGKIDVREEGGKQ